MKSPAPLARARTIALRYVAAAARTQAQVRARLARAELADQADDVVGWLLGLGYLDDGAWARSRARSLVAPGRLGPRLAEERLVRAGLDRAAARAAVAEAVAEASGGGGELALCRALADRRLRGAPTSSLDGRSRQRLARFLLGRGFSASAVAQVLGEPGGEE